jgi:glycosyltransferase involved in cell wall biosynthesis
MKKMTISVALCTYNPKPQLLQRVIDSILIQLGFRENAEFIIVDNNSYPPVRELEINYPHSVRLVQEPKQGLTAAREAAIANVKGDIILFVDDDNILAPGYVDGVLEAFLDERLGLLGGAIYPEYESPPPAWFLEFENLIAIRRYPSSLRVRTTDFRHSDFFPVGAGFAVRTALARAYADDCNAGTRIEGRKGAALSSGEDIDLGLYVLSQGYFLLATGALRLEHVIPAFRCNEAYIKKLVRSGLMSSAEIERKWGGKQVVFPLLNKPKWKIQVRSGVFLFLSLFSPRYRIKHEIFATVAELMNRSEILVGSKRRDTVRR